MRRIDRFKTIKVIILCKKYCSDMISVMLRHWIGTKLAIALNCNLQIWYVGILNYQIAGKEENDDFKEFH